MTIELQHVKPAYMSESEVSASQVYLQPNVQFEPGKKYLIQAGSGHGKTSILNFIYGSSGAYDGSIHYDASPLQGAALFALRQHTLSYVFQDFKLFPELTLIENIQLKNGLTNEKQPQELKAWIDHIQLGHRHDHPVKNLSLGQKQRVAIIRALCQPFQWLLMDEPFSHLDQENIDLLCPLIEEELKHRKAGMILTSLGDRQQFEYDQVLNL